MSSWTKVLASASKFQADYQKQLARWRETLRKGGIEPPTVIDYPMLSALHYWAPAGLFNAMIYPLAHTRLSGVVWYQGKATP
jgi:hypothetical protein